MAWAAAARTASPRLCCCFLSAAGSFFFFLPASFLATVRTSLSSPAVAHLHPTAELAERALLPDDPGQALALTRVLYDETPRMFNHHRGLWGYTGIALDGAPLTVQSTGIGGPSAAIVVAELHALGLRRAVRIGRAWALDGALRAGELVAATAVVADDGASRALGAGARDRARRRRSPPRCAATAPALLASADVDQAQRAADALAFDLESAAVLAAAARAGIPAACLVRDRGGRRSRRRRRAPGARARWRPSRPCASRSDRRGAVRSAGRRPAPRRRRRFAASRLGVDVRRAASSLVIASSEACRPARRSSRRSTPSSMPSRRWETDRRRRVRRSMSAADGMFSAPNATSWACGGLLAGLERARDGAVDERVLEQILGQAPEGVLALSGEALAQAVAAGFLVHDAERYRFRGIPGGGHAGRRIDAHRLV